MKKGDFVWGIGLMGVVLLLLLPATHEPIMEGTKEHPLLAGFIKFFVLATMGDLLAIRMVGGTWQKPQGLIYRMVVWGLIGSIITCVFEVYSSGVNSAITKGFFPVGNGLLEKVLWAFWVSLVMNATFGQVLMVFHRITDTFIDLAEGRLTKFGSVGLKAVSNHIAWQELAEFAFKINLCLWLPCHTVVFLLPPLYRVLAAAFLSMLLGGVLGYAKSRKVKAQGNLVV